MSRFGNLLVIGDLRIVFHCMANNWSWWRVIELDKGLGCSFLWKTRFGKHGSQQGGQERSLFSSLIWRSYAPLGFCWFVSLGWEAKAFYWMDFCNPFYIYLWTFFFCARFSSFILPGEPDNENAVLYYMLIAVHFHHPTITPHLSQWII